MYDVIKTAIEDAQLSHEMEVKLGSYLPQEEEDYQNDCEDLFDTMQNNNSIFHYEATDKKGLSHIGDYDNSTEAHSN